MNVGEKMSQALYREYRPRRFEDVLGQDHIVNTLRNQIKNNNIGHAYLFSGTRGTGKTSTAKIFSRAVNCLNNIDGSPCNECEICRGLLDGSIMDVIEMDAASNRGVNDIRELRDKVAYPPSSASYKVYIIDEVHMLTQEAFNALLKTLEEPPKHLIFILATTEPEKIPQTILSRCQRFDFKRITTELIIENMKKITDSLALNVEEDALKLIARNADGGMRDALSLLDQCISFSDGDMKYEDALEILGIVNLDVVFSMVDSIVARSIEDILLTIDKMLGDGRDVHQFIRDIIKHFRDLMIVKTFKNSSRLVEVDGPTMEKYEAQARELRLDYIVKILEILTEVDTKAKNSTEPRVLLEMAMIKIVRSENLSLEERIERLEAGKLLVKTPKEVSKKDRPREEKTPEVGKGASLGEKTSESKESELKVKEIDPVKDKDLVGLRENWEAIKNKVKSIQVSTSVLLQHSEITGFDGKFVDIDYPEAFETMRKLIANENNKKIVEDVLTEFLGEKIEVRFGLLKEKIEEVQKEPIEDIEKQVIEFFGEDKLEIKE